MGVDTTQISTMAGPGCGVAVVLLVEDVVVEAVEIVDVDEVADVALLAVVVLVPPPPQPASTSGTVASTTPTARRNARRGVPMLAGIRVALAFTLRPLRADTGATPPVRGRE